MGSFYNKWKLKIYITCRYFYKLRFSFSFVYRILVLKNKIYFVKFSIPLDMICFSFHHIAQNSSHDINAGINAETIF